MTFYVENESGYEFEFSGDELYKFYMSLERLDEKWEKELEKLKKLPNPSPALKVMLKSLQANKK